MDLIQYSSGPSEVDTVTIPILQTRKLRQREVEWLIQLVSGRAGVSVLCLPTTVSGWRLMEDLSSHLQPLLATLPALSYHDGGSDGEDVDHAVLQSHSIVWGSHVAQHGAVEESSCDEAHMAQHHQHQPRLHQHLPEVTHTQATCGGQPCQVRAMAGWGWGGSSRWAEEKTEVLVFIVWFSLSGEHWVLNISA